MLPSVMQLDDLEREIASDLGEQCEACIGFSGQGACRATESESESERASEEEAAAQNTDFHLRASSRAGQAD